jgi:ATP-dependent Lon protease
MKKVEDVLNESHYGLENVKERITEYLAVRARSPKGKSPIVCLVGPPGVGKTSLAISIAKALGKKYIKLSLGGVKDVAEINGHRRTYVNSIPGRIIKGMKEVGVINPLFILDEIDKLSGEHSRGDAAAALLEVLDPEQNKIYTDSYIEQPYDLSNVMFICTANYIEQIPDPLQDRMEIIELTSYTELEKLHIAKNYLINKIYESTNTNESHVSFSDEILMYIIRHYTREAGVRELNRQLDKITRKVIKKLSFDENYKEEINTTKQVEHYLGKIIFDYTIKDENTKSGIVNGMAYTSAGGDLLPIEVTTFVGKGNVVITGNLKETMKESVQVALSFVKSKAEKFGLKNFDFASVDIHIHVPSGGIPKDGPSAGVTLTTAIISRLKKFKVPSNIAMTGEITLRGKVGVIGGIREKMISAFRGGVTEFFIPIANERDLINVPNEIKDNVSINLVTTYDDIYKKIFVDGDYSESIDNQID